MLGNLGGWVEQVIAGFGYPGLAALMLLENLFPPIPSELVLPLAGFLVSRGDLGFVAATGVATVGSLAGAFALYALGRWGGRPLVLRYGRLLRVKEADLDRADGWFEKYGGALVFFGRMVPGVRSVVSIPAGLSKMALGRFALLSASGSAVWNALLIGAGFYLGANWSRVADIVGPISNAVLIMGLVAAFGLAAWWWRRTRRRAR